MKMLQTTSLFFVACYWASVVPAYAYLDGGSASIILQAIIGSLAAVGAGFYSVRSKIKAFYRKLFVKDQSE